MLAYAAIMSSALLTAAVALYSGFGLGTVLMPVFALFFPVEVAVAATAIVHGSNNIFKIALIGRLADRSLVLRFGIPAIVAALLGALALGYVSGLGQLGTYQLGHRTAVVTPLKLLMAVLMFIFALFELLPGLRHITFDRRYLFLGGLLSGFFGGLSGHQGALRSAFLVKVGVSTEAFVGTNAVIGFMVDVARLSTYAVLFFLTQTTSPIAPEQWPLIWAGVGAAWAGVVIGKRFLHKVTMKTVQAVTGFLLLLIAMALGSGLV